MSENFQMPKPKPKKMFLKIILGIVALVIVAVGVLAYLGRLSFVLKEPNQSIVLNTTVCDDKIISSLNTATQSQTEEQYDNRIKAVATDVLALSGHENDPNCTYILFRYYATIADLKNAQKYANQFETFVNKGDNVSDKIVDIESLQRVKDDVKTLEQNIKLYFRGDSG